MKLALGEHHIKLLIIGQCGFRSRLGVNRQQAIGWANVKLDLYQHVTSLGHLWFMQNGIEWWSNLCLYEGWGVGCVVGVEGGKRGENKYL